MEKKTIEAVNRQPAVTVFKSIAILMVVLVHIAQPFTLPNGLKYITRLGQLGCQIFFVLSSYTLCFSLDRNKVSFFAFQKKRLQRILPGYWSMIVVYVLIGSVSLLLFDENLLGTSLDWKHILVNIFLLNGFVPGKANNLVVRGGWYVGTSMILYLLMPFMYKIYNHTSEKWKKNRIWFFPLLITICSDSILIIASLIDSNLLCSNNSFVYFSFLNQLPCFSLGFALYDYKKNYRKNKSVYVVLLCLASGALFVFLFYSGWKWAFVFVPTVFALFFCFLFSLVSENIDSRRNPKMFQKWGEYSFSVYLVHSLVVYECSKIVKRVCNTFLDLPEWIIFVFWVPIAYFFIYYLGKLFSKYLLCLESLLKRRKHGNKN